MFVLRGREQLGCGMFSVQPQRRFSAGSRPSNRSAETRSGQVVSTGTEPWAVNPVQKMRVYSSVYSEYRLKHYEYAAKGGLQN